MYDCRVCGGRMVLLEKRCDVDGWVQDVALCTGCYVIDNASITPADTTAEATQQRAASCAHYTVTDTDLAHIRHEVDATRTLLAHFLPDLGENVSARTFLDVGCGRGLLLLAADALGFGTVIGVDLNTESAAATLCHFPPTRPIAVLPDLADVPAVGTLGSLPADVVFLWHTLEHISTPHTFLDTLTPRLNAHALFVAQVPQYHADYIFATHYHFYNEPSLTHLLTAHGFHIDRFEYDGERHYLTVVARYQG